MKVPRPNTVSAIVLWLSKHCTVVGGVLCDGDSGWDCGAGGRMKASFNLP